MARMNLTQLLQAEESETLERKAGLSDKDAIRKCLIAFANDSSNKGGGTIIIGQNPDKSICGLKVGKDEAQQSISDLARNQCHPSIPIKVDIFDVQEKLVAIVRVDTSISRPHFRGESYVRQGSTNRIATGAEIIALRASAVDLKVRQLLAWKLEGKNQVTCVQMQHMGVGGDIYSHSYAELGEITDTYIVVKYNPPITVPLEDLRLGYDYQRNQPQLIFRRYVS